MQPAEGPETDQAQNPLKMCSAEIWKGRIGTSNCVFGRNSLIRRKLTLDEVELLPLVLGVVGPGAEVSRVRRKTL